MNNILLTKATCNIIDNITSNIVVVEYEQKIYTATYSVNTDEYLPTQRFLDNYHSFMLHNEGRVMLVIGTGPLLALINEKPVLKTNDKFQFATEYSLNIIENELFVRHGGNYYGGAEINDDLKAILLGYIESVAVSSDKKLLNVMVQDFTSIKLNCLSPHQSTLLDQFRCDFNNSDVESTLSDESDDSNDLHDLNTTESKKVVNENSVNNTDNTTNELSKKLDNPFAYRAQTDKLVYDGGLKIGVMEKDGLYSQSPPSNN